MPRTRSPKRDQAYKIWLDSDGSKKLKDIAAELEVSETQIRKWKNQDKWNSNVTNLNSNVTKRKHGGQPGNKTQSDTVRRREIRMQKSSVSSRSIFRKRPFLLSRRCRRTRWTSSGIRSRSPMLPLSGHSRSCMSGMQRIRQSRKSNEKTAT